MQSIDAYTISIKTNDGKWIEIPALHQTAYHAYVKYCVDNNIPAVSLAEFYGAFNVLANADFLNELVNTIGGAGVLPVNLGGTGVTNAPALLDKFNLYDRDEVDQLINPIKESIKGLEEQLTKLEARVNNLKVTDLGLSIGLTAPDDQGTPGEVYLRVDQSEY